MQVVESKQLKTDVPSFQVGDTLILHQRLLDGQKERIQTFEGDLIARNALSVESSAAS